MAEYKSAPCGRDCSSGVRAVEKQHRLLMCMNGGGVEDLIRCASFLLQAPLCLYGVDHTVITMSSERINGFDFWNDIVQSGQVPIPLLTEGTVHPEFTVPVLRQIHSDSLPCECTVAELPVGDAGESGGLAAFAWEHELSDEDLTFLALTANLVCAYFQQTHQQGGVSRASRMKLIRELLQYKPGLRPAMTQRIYMEQLHDLSAPFRVVYLDLSGRLRSSPESYCNLLGQALDGAWILMDDDKMLAVFNEELISPKEYLEPLQEFLRENRLSACISAPFDSLLDLRHNYEIAQDCFSIASRKEPEKQLFFSEEYMLLSFLAKCQRHFALDAYYPNGLKKLLAAQSTLGYDAALTLHTYFNCHCSVNATANTLYIHRNTALHRLSRMREILGLDLDDPNVCLYLHLALHMLEQSPEAAHAEDPKQSIRTT
ncbi:MAG: helix-turn-helix domain-containing protein [Clostridia bacterium]|nr:helix-turn-helix domain-containing protein [Clostridia bacterium]